MAIVKINDVSLADPKRGYPISDIQVDLTSGFEASIAEFSVYDVYDEAAGKFDLPATKVKILLGSKVEVFLGPSYPLTSQVGSWLLKENEMKEPFVSIMY